MGDFISKSFYGNTLLQWSIAATIIIVSIVIGRIIYWVIGTFVKKAAANSKSRLDNILIDMFEEPIIFGIILAGIWFGLKSLTLSEFLDSLIAKAYYVLIIFNVAWLLTRLFDALVEEYLVPLIKKSKSDLDDQILPVVRKAVKISIWVLALIIALNNAGYDVGALLAGLGIGGLAFALAAQDTVSNLFGGFTIFTDKPFKINDRVNIDGFDGFVREIGIRSTRLQTLDGRTVTIPNSNIVNNAIVNISSEPSRKIKLSLGLTYDMDETKILKAMDLLKQIAANNNDLIEDKIILSFINFGDFSLNILFIYYIRKQSDIFEAQTKINLDILKTFNKNGLEFAFPSQTIYTKSI